MSLVKKMCTLFCDVDGTLIKYRKFCHYKSTEAEPVSMMVDEMNKAYDKGHTIVLTTARPEWLRYHTMKELDEIGLQYHQLVMGLARGNRILINDNEKEGDDRTFAFNVKRDVGFNKDQLDKLNSMY